MKKLTALFVALALMLTLSATAFAEKDLDEMSKLIVTGNATVALTADMATLELGAQTRGRTVGEAHQENTKIIEDVLKALKEMGIPEEDIRTSSYYVYFEPDYSVTNAVERLINGSFSVTNMLQVIIRDVGQVSKAIDAAANAGANSINSLSFQSTKATEGYNKALQRAVDDARVKAAVLAEAAGRELGIIVKIEVNEAYGVPFGISNRIDFESKDAAATPILSGDVSVTANVVVTFEMK